MIKILKHVIKHRLYISENNNNSTWFIRKGEVLIFLLF